MFGEGDGAVIGSDHRERIHSAGNMLSFELCGS